MDAEGSRRSKRTQVNSPKRKRLPAIVPEIPPKPGEKTKPGRFTIVVDSDEKRAYRFQGLHDGSGPSRRYVVVPTVRRSLPVGDYTIEGLESEVIIERKSLEDLFGSISPKIGKGEKESPRDNFKRRLEKMAAYRFSVVIVEAELSTIIYAPPEFSKLNPKSASRTLIAFNARYPTKWVFCPTREVAEGMTYRMLERFFKDRTENEDEAE